MASPCRASPPAKAKASGWSTARQSGRFNVRVDRRVHRALAIEAARAHVSLNALVAQKLARVVDIAI